MLGYVSTARWGGQGMAGEGEGTERTGLLFWQAGGEVDSHSFGGNRGYEQSLGRRNELHSASQALVESFVTSARRASGAKRLQG